MHIWAIDLWQSDMIAYRSIDHSIASGILPLWVDLLPPLCLRTSSGKVVLERSELEKSCLRQNATPFVEGSKKCMQHLLSETLTCEMYRLYMGD